MINTQKLENDSSNRHIRTIGKAAEWFRSIDEGSPIRYSTIRTAILNGDLPCVTIGNKRLIVLEEAYRYFYGAELDPKNVLF